MRSGFVYVWRDCKSGRFYIGAHWGAEDDGYICSSSWMKRAYVRRPRDFRRRIITRGVVDRSHLITEEHRWLQMIKKEELGKRYYNLKNHRFGHWASDECSRMSVGQKISASPNRSANMSKAQTGRKQSEETKKRLSIINTGRKGHIPSEETRVKLSAWQKGQRRGPLKADTRIKQSLALKGRKKTIEQIEAVRAALIGLRWVNFRGECKRIRPELLDDYIANGWVLGFPHVRGPQKAVDPEVREQRIKNLRIAVRRPEARARKSKSVLAAFAADPTIRTRISAAVKLAWADPVRRARHCAGIKAGCIKRKARKG